MKRRCLIAVLATISVLALAACGEKQEVVSGRGSRIR